MPSYVNSAFQKPILALKGVPCYLWGKFDYKIGNTKLAVTNVALASNVATVTVLLVDGPLPVVGGFISIINTATSSGIFNVNRAVITGVSINAITGQGTITFALTHADVSAASDSGSVIVEPAEVPETLAAGASIACVYQLPESDSQLTIPMTVTFPTAPTAATATLQRALKNATTVSEWTNTSAVVTYASSAYSAGPTVTATLERGYLYRINISGLTGSGTVIGKLG